MNIIILGANPIKYNGNHTFFFTHKILMLKKSNIKRIEAIKYKTPEKEIQIIKRGMSLKSKRLAR